MRDTAILLTAQIPGTGGAIKTHDEDFCVEELPLYEASGSGDHTYAFIEKQGVGAREAIDRIARALNVNGRNIGSAGLKDVHAVTRQWISIEHVSPERVQKVSVPGIRILEVTRHTNKLKPGHLAGNRFVVRVRDLAMPVDEALQTAQSVLSVLARKGLPNAFGTQRFGNRDNNHLLGKAVIANSAADFVELFLGHPLEGIDSPATLHGRRLYTEGHYEEALSVWPAQMREHVRALRALVKSQGDKTRAFYAVDKHLKGFFVSAYQSDLFNRVLAARMPDIDKILLGDMAYKHVNGACFRVEEPDVEQPRCVLFEISPTGPLLGQRTARLEGPAGDIENPILAAEGLHEDAFRQMKRLGARGGRRPPASSLATPKSPPAPTTTAPTSKSSSNCPPAPTPPPSSTKSPNPPPPTIPQAEATRKTGPGTFRPSAVIALFSASAFQRTYPSRRSNMAPRRSAASASRE